MTAEFKKYRIKVEYTKYVGGIEQFADTAVIPEVWERGESQARGRAKAYVAAVAGGRRYVGSTEVIDV